MDMDLERDQQRRTYAICRVGFGLLSVALALACLTSWLGLLYEFFALSQNFRGAQIVARVMQSRAWHWIDLPIVWGSLLGCYLLWGRWSEPGWQRRSGLLVVMCMVDGFNWFIDHGGDLRIQQEFGHQWLRHHLGVALGWAEFALIAGLAGDLMAHLGYEQAPEAGKATRSLAATGAAIWLLFFLNCTDWNGRWPLKPAPMRTIQVLMLYAGYTMIWAIALVQVTVLTWASTIKTSRVLTEMDREDQEHDLLRPTSDEHVSLLARDFEEF